MCKKAFCLIFAFLFSLESFAAVVSDNDGSAFITKAEYDSLKNDFQSRIDQYNTNIDSKIDSAIASYLAGILIDKEASNYWKQYVDVIGGYPLIAKSFEAGTASVTPTRNVRTELSMVAEVVNNLEFHIATMRQPACYTSTPIYGATVNFHSVIICGTPTNYDKSTGYQGKYISNVYTQNAHHSNWAIINYTPSFSFLSSNSKERYSVKRSEINETTTTSGSGNAWLYQVINGIPCLKYFCTQLYPEYDIVIKNSKYKKYTLDNASYFTSTGKSINASSVGWTQQNVSAQLGRLVSAGSSGDATSTAPTKNYVEVSTSLIKASDGNNYLNIIWALKSDSKIYCYDEDYQGIAATAYTNFTGRDLEWYDEYFAGLGADRQVNTLAKASAGVKLLQFAPSYTNLKSFGSYAFSSIAGRNVYHGNGVPLAKINDDDKKYAIKINVGCASNPNIELKISNAPFNLGSFESSAKQYINSDITKGENNFTIDVNKKDTLLWVWLYNKSNNDILTINDFDIKIEK